MGLITSGTSRTTGCWFLGLFLLMAPAPSADSSQSIAELVAYLFTRREAILTNWRSACEQDSALEKVALFSREEFNNLLPIILDILEQRLLNKPLEADPALTAQTHGLHRWHKAHTLIDTMQELNHLTRTLYSELDLFQRLFPNRDMAMLLHVHQQIAQIMQETIDGSVQKYDELQRLAATNRASTLQMALDQMEALSRQRGDLLRTSSHDLRGSFGIINSAAYLLGTDGVSEPERAQYVDMLNRNLINVHDMLSSLMDLSRLEAGQERLEVESFDVAQLIQEMVDSAQPMATQQKIVLWADGPQTLTIETDRIKLQRIVQNILTNALKYTTPSPGRPSIVSVSWSQEGDYRWVVSIQDSGPGLPTTAVGVFGQQLRPTVEPTSVMGPEQGEPVNVLPINVPTIPNSGELAKLAHQPTKGEGVGLQIVKMLCELLNANLDIETQPSRGTLFRVRMPICHNG